MLLLRAGRALGVIAFVSGCACLLHASILLVRDGPAAFAFALGHAGAALPTLAAAPLFLLAAGFSRIGSSWAGATFGAGVLVLSLLPSVAHGIDAPGWYVQPALILLASVFLGVVPGLTVAICAAAALLWTSGPDGWSTRVLLVGAAFLCSGLLGALVHNVFRAALEIERAQSRRLEEAAEQLRQRERLLSRSMRIETMGELAGLVAHQLRNLFQVMVGHAELSEGATDEEKERHMAMVRDRLAAGRRLLDQMLDLAHPEEGIVERCDLVALCATFVEGLRSLLPAGVELRTRFVDEQLPVALDRTGFEHVLLNLAINANHAMSGRGCLRLSVERVEDNVAVRVADDGGGIPPEDLSRIFDPYYTTKPRGQGTGLGLASVRRFVRAAGGTVGVDSVLGEGTTFTLTFPLAAELVQLRKGG